MIGIPIEDIKKGEHFRDGYSGVVYEMIDEFDGWVAAVANLTTQKYEQLHDTGAVYYLVSPDMENAGRVDTLEIFPPATCVSCDGKGRYCDFKAVGWPIVECKDCDGTGII